MRSLFDLLRDRALASAMEFPRRDVEERLPRSVFHERFLRVHEELSVAVQTWLVCSTQLGPAEATKLAGVENLSLSCQSFVKHAGTFLRLFHDVRHLALRGFVNEMDLVGRFAIPDLPRLRSVAFVDVDFGLFDDPLANHRLTAFSVEYRGYSGSFFDAFQDRPQVLRGVTTLRIIEHQHVPAWARKKDLFCNLAACCGELPLQFVDIRLNAAPALNHAVTQFLTTKCAATLRRLKTNQLILGTNDCFPVLETLDAEVPPGGCEAISLRAVFPRLARVHLRVRVADEDNACMENQLACLRQAFDHVADYSLGWGHRGMFVDETMFSVQLARCAGLVTRYTCRAGRAAH